MEWAELMVGGIIGAIIGLIIGLIFQFFLDFYFGCIHLRPLIGKYNVTYKNGEKAENIEEVEVKRVKGRVLFVESKSKSETLPAESEIYFQTPKSGNGWYKHLQSDSFGLREVIKINNNKLAVWNKYTKDAAHIDPNDKIKCDPKMFSSIDQSYIWEKIDK